MSSTLSLGSQDIEERAPGGVHDGFRQMMVLHHPINIQVLNGNMLILFSILFGDLEMKVTTLPLDLQVGVCGALRSFAPSLRTLLPACNRALLASERLLTLAIIAWVLDGTALAIGQE